MPGYAQRVHVPVAHADGNLPGRLHGVDMDGHAVPVCDARDLVGGFDGADLVVGEHDGNQQCAIGQVDGGSAVGMTVGLVARCRFQIALRQLAFQRSRIDMRLTVHRNAHDLHAEPLFQPLRRLRDGRMFDCGDDDARAHRFPVLLAQCPHAGHGDAFDGKIVGFRAS